MSAPYRYALALTREQAGAVALACEAFARIGMGQLSGIGDHTPGATTVDGLMALREALRAVEPLATTGLPPNASNGKAAPPAADADDDEPPVLSEKQRASLAKRLKLSEDEAHSMDIRGRMPGDEGYDPYEGDN